MDSKLRALVNLLLYLRADAISLDHFRIPLSKYQPNMIDIISQAKANIAAAQRYAGKILPLNSELKTGVSSIFIIQSTDLEMISYQIQNTIPNA